MMLDYKKLLESLLRELIDKKIISEWYCNGAGYFWKYNEKDKRILKLEKENAELKNKIADIKANCDLAIEGRDVKIMELEADNKLLEQRGSDILKELLDKNKKCKQLEKEKEETRKKVIEIFANDEMQQGELWKACGLRLVGWDYEKNQLDEQFMTLYGVSN